LNFRRLARWAVVAIAPIALAGCGYNTIPTKEEQARAKWADVQGTYQRRADLIPNLVETVRGYAAQERAVLTEVTQARARATAVTVDASTLTDPAAMARYAAAQDQLSGVLGRLMMIQERYPDLKSNQNFLALQNEIEATENRINIARRDYNYNEAARDYNTSLRTFPTVIWAKTLHSGSKPMQLFTATASAQTAPTVDFGSVGAAPAAPALPGAPGGTAAPVAPGSAPPAALPAPTPQPAPAQ
jgi:LemA protein